MADSTEARREWLKIVVSELSQNPNANLSEWPDEMRENLTELCNGLSLTLDEVNGNIHNGTDTNELRAKSLLKNLRLGKGPGKPSDDELSVSLLLQKQEQYRTLRAILANENIPYTSDTINEIANTTATVEDVLIAGDLTETKGRWNNTSDKLPTVTQKAIEQVANELGIDPTELGKTVYRHRVKLYSLPEFRAFLRIHSQPIAIPQ